MWTGDMKRNGQQLELQFAETGGQQIQNRVLRFAGPELVGFAAELEVVLAAELVQTFPAATRSQEAAEVDAAMELVQSFALTGLDQEAADMTVELECAAFVTDAVADLAAK